MVHVYKEGSKILKIDRPFLSVSTIIDMLSNKKMLQKNSNVYSTEADVY